MVLKALIVKGARQDLAALVRHWGIPLDKLGQAGQAVHPKCEVIPASDPLHNVTTKKLTVRWTPGHRDLRTATTYQDYIDIQGNNEIGRPGKHG